MPASCSLQVLACIGEFSKLLLTVAPAYSRERAPHRRGIRNQTLTLWRYFMLHVLPIFQVS